MFSRSGYYPDVLYKATNFHKMVITINWHQITRHRTIEDLLSQYSQLRETQKFHIRRRPRRENLGIGKIWLLVTPPKPKLPVYSLSTENIISNNIFYIQLDVKHKKPQKKYAPQS